ncbi:hypothetical protein QBC46DRAFT_357843 [Diplogelasinospora grovesii]|uniref:Nephrocystin 3-like N-terminal domain-containing protein n=1 Tax=Diplogelasinospora grovesii TaxID=303347 RepID=A0AAN6MZP9_9PEZI|nr:hypothetical protein QBC46DRAFT_357843 [Diplogelasinospora grovesii]
MDPLTALSVAASVIQFVQFASSLISNTSEICNSANGASADNLHLEDVYGKLESFSITLSAHKLRGKASPDQVLALVQLSNDWIVREKALEEREFSLHLASFIRDQVSGLNFRLVELRGENARLHIDQSCKLDEISEGIERLSQGLRGVQGRQGSGAAEEGTLGPNQLERVASMLTDVISTERGALAEQAVLGSLHFSQRPHRHENIADAHKDTFEWIYNSDCPFAQWLVSETGIFWVSGKAGSGKSTLMKFITSNPSTNSLLSEWAPNGLITAAHYFWSAGTEMQKSQKGLLQTLLYDIFQSSPELMAGACPKRLAGGWKVRGRKGTEPWSLPELSAALNYIAMADDVPCKFCFFIDGLDEYDGDHLDLCNLMTSLSNSKNIKLCVSSRPWNVFKDAFRSGPKLCMQDLTRGDILSYVNDRLLNHPRWELLAVGSEAKKQVVHNPNLDSESFLVRERGGAAAALTCVEGVRPV